MTKGLNPDIVSDASSDSVEEERRIEDMGARGIALGGGTNSVASTSGPAYDDGNDSDVGCDTGDMDDVESV